MTSIPLVDFSRVSTEGGRVPSESDWADTASEIGSALSKVGFVYIKNHHVPQNKILKSFEESRKFFELPVEVKQRYTKQGKVINYGYAEPGQELLNADSTFELRETFDFSRDPVQPVPSGHVPDFHPTLFDLSNESRVLVRKLLRILAISLGLEDHNFFIKSSKCLDDTSVPSYTTFRTLFYPPIDRDLPPGSVRCAEHSDYGILTILFQDHLGGLEVKDVSGAWIPADPIEGTILVNTGDLLEFWSGGFFPATHHRVLIPSEELRKRVARQSIVYFIHPDDDIIVSPLRPGSEFEPIRAYDHAKKKLDLSYKY